MPEFIKVWICPYCGFEQFTNLWKCDNNCGYVMQWIDKETIENVRSGKIKRLHTKLDKLFASRRNNSKYND